MSHWAPATYRPMTESGRISAFQSGDIYRAILASILHYNAGITRIEMAILFRRVIARHNSGGWGRQWTLTTNQFNNLANPEYDFELAWRSIDPETVGAYGV